MQMKVVKRPLHRISNVPRMLAPETRVWDSVGSVQCVVKVEAEARLAVTRNVKSLIVMRVRGVEVIAALYNVARTSNEKIIRYS